MSYEMMLLAAQAAGVATNLYASAQASKVLKSGNRIDKAQIDLQMEQEALASTEQSLFATEQLREVLATQRAIMGARGQATGVGSAGAAEQKSLGLFNADERARQLSLNFRGAQLKGQKSLLDISLYGQKAKLGASQVQQGLNTLSVNLQNKANKAKTAQPGPWKNPNNLNAGSSGLGGGS